MRPVSGADRIGSQLCEHARLGEKKIVFGDSAGPDGKAQKIGKRLHEKTVVVAHEPLRLPQRPAGERLRRLQIAKRKLAKTVFRLCGEEIAIDGRNFARRRAEYPVSISERILQPVGGQPGRVVVRNRIAVIVVHIVRAKPERTQKRLYLHIAGKNLMRRRLS